MAELSGIDVLIASLIFLISGMVKGVIGMAFPLVSLALLTLVYGTKAAIVLYIVPSLLSNLYQAFGRASILTLVREHWLMLGPSLVLIGPGVWFLGQLNASILAACMGTMVITYAAFQLKRGWGTHERSGLRPWQRVFIGLGNGLAMGMTGSCVMPISLYIHRLKIPKEQLIQLLGVVFLPMSVLLFLFLRRWGHLDWELVLGSLAAVIPTFLGMRFGAQIRHRLSSAKFSQIFSVALLLVGAAMILKSLIG